MIKLVYTLRQIINQYFTLMKFLNKENKYNRLFKQKLMI